MDSSIQNYLTTMQNSTAVLDAAASKERMGSSSIDKYAFLKLLTEQLRHQDPLKPMDNMEFISQQAQFTQIEELQNLSKAINISNVFTQSSSLVGKQVSVINPDNPAEYITGTVTAAHFANGNSAIEINGTLYPIDIVAKVENPATSTTTSE